VSAILRRFAAGLKPSAEVSLFRAHSPNNWSSVSAAAVMRTGGVRVNMPAYAHGQGYTVRLDKVQQTRYSLCSSL
jgi:hypothetical protein